MNSFTLRLQSLMDAKADPDDFFELAKEAYLASQNHTRFRRDVLSEHVSIIARESRDTKAARLVSWCEGRGIQTIGDLVRTHVLDKPGIGTSTADYIRSSVFLHCGRTPLNSFINDIEAWVEFRSASVFFWEEAESFRLSELGEKARFAVMWLKHYRSKQNASWPTPPPGQAVLGEFTSAIGMIYHEARAKHHDGKPFRGEKIRSILEYRDGQRASIVVLTNNGNVYDLMRSKQ